MKPGRVMKLQTDALLPTLDAVMGEGVPVGVLSWNAVRTLHEQFGKRYVKKLVKLAAKHDKPICLHLEPKDMTAFISPPGWSQERLMGYIAPHRDTLESAFGEISVMGDGAKAMRNIRAKDYRGTI